MSQTNDNKNVCSSSTTSSSSCLSHDDGGDVVFFNGNLLSLKLFLSTPSSHLFDQTHKPNQETKKPHHRHSSCSFTNLCLELSLRVGPCSLCWGETTTNDSKKRKRVPQETSSVSRKNNKNMNCSASTADGPWKIKKVIQKSDLGNMSRLLIKKEIARQFIVPKLGGSKAAEKGVKVGVFDVDTNSLHSLVFKIWPSNETHVFIDTWVKEFVRRRGLIAGDEIGLKWDQDNGRFDFSVLSRANPTSQEMTNSV